MTEEKRHTIKIILGFTLAIFGMIMLLIGLFCPPIGAIEPSVLAAYGEVSTFSAALIGIDALYKYNYRKILNEHEEKMADKKDE